MSKAHRLKPRKTKALTQAVSLNFLLGGSDADLDSFELLKLSNVADLRKELHGILDRLVEEMSQAALARWFLLNDRKALKCALETEEDAIAWAKREIRESQRSAAELIPRPSLPIGASHRAAALRYSERNISEGKCEKCPQPLASGSVRYCQQHLDYERARYTPKGRQGKAIKKHERSKP